ncbi:MAG: T9SS type A sorting domain-containing protein [Flavobacteriales bacterium]|jgi:hypothetical protein|nr:T9SS type A sorting domain-containing protein [Flavobacteriales bacterium]
MRSLFSIATVALIAAGAQAQHNGHYPLPNLGQLQGNEPVQQPMQHPPSEQGTDRDVLFTEDFANGLVGNNGVGSWTLEGANGNIWRFNNHSPTGAYTSGNQYIQSTTAANGAAIFASDSANSDWSGSSPVIVASPVDFEGSLVSPLLDLSATPYVGISFQQKSRFCCSSSPFYLEISNDGGATWPGSFITNEGLPLNQGATGVPGGPVTTETRSFAITAYIAANPGNVKFRFRHNSEAGSSHYYWQIDDVNIYSLPPNEIAMDYAYTSQFGGGYEYGRVPQSQMLPTMDVGGSITNNGSTDQTNVVMNVSILDEANVEVANLAIPVGTVAPGDAFVSEAQITLPDPMPVGTYTAHFTMTSDQIAMDEDPSNNEKYRYFAVTADLYSMDAIGVVPNQILTTTRTGTGSFLDNTQDVRLLNYFEINTAEMFYGGEIVLSTANTDVGSYFTMSVYDTVDVLGPTLDLSSPLAQSDIRVITQADLDNGGVVGLSFLDPIMLNPGAYFVSANMFQESGNDLYILDDTTVPQPSIASMLWIPIDDQNQHLYGGNGTAWAVRLSSQLNVGVQEAPALDGVTMYPSPTTGPVQIRSEIAGQMTVEVFNALGTLVQTASFNGTATSLDLSGNAAGIYTIRVGDGTNYSVQRIALK